MTYPSTIKILCLETTSITIGLDRPKQKFDLRYLLKGAMFEYNKKK